MFKKKKKKDKDLSVECWNLDYELIKWLNTHLRVFVDDCNIALDAEKFVFKREEKTFGELLERLMYITDTLYNGGEYIWTKNNNNLTIKEISELKDEMYDILKLVHWQLWW